MCYVSLSSKGESIYQATYQTMLDRLNESGFAKTSLTGTYPGMFIRDASIQVMAHLAEGDMQCAKRILQYMAAYHRAINADYGVHVICDLAEEEWFDYQDVIAEDVVIDECAEKVFSLPDSLNDTYIVSVEIPLQVQGELSGQDTVTATLYKGETMVDEITHAMISTEKIKETFRFCLPVEACDLDSPYAIKISASCPTRVFSAQNTIRVGVQKNIDACSWRIQPDGHYMWMNAFAMFALKSFQENECFIRKVYPFMVDYCKYFFNDSNYMHVNGLICNPMYEHTRNGRYWNCYDLMTNMFASEASHKMSQLALLLSDKENEAYFSLMATALAESIHENLVYQMDGVKIYTEMIALDEGGRIVPGFSFVSLAPVACDWYAADSTIVSNTYAMYRKYGTERYHNRYDMLVACRELDDGRWHELYYNHVIGKGLAWEIYYLWKTEQNERLQQMLDFMDTYSRDVYPEVWDRSGNISDSANQEQASWLLYEMARITGRCSD